MCLLTLYVYTQFSHSFCKGMFHSTMDGDGTILVPGFTRTQLYLTYHI